MPSDRSAFSNSFAGTGASRPGQTRIHDSVLVGGAGAAGRFPAHHLNQIELARRWRVSPRTLERWRWLNQGPPYLKLGGRVVYRLADIEAFEAAQAHG
jgi:Helix-turn-helix domain